MRFWILIVLLLIFATCFSQMHYGGSTRVLIGEIGLDLIVGTVARHQEIEPFSIDAMDIAEEKITESKELVKELESSGLSVYRLNDIILEAERLKEIADQYSIIKHSKNELLKIEARKRLQLIPEGESEISYLDVNKKLSELEEVVKLINDVDNELGVIKVKLSQIHGINPHDDLQVLLSPEVSLDDNERASVIEIEKAYREERYEDIPVKIESLNRYLELKQEEQTTLAILRKNTQSYIAENWRRILVYVLVILIVYSMIETLYGKIKLKGKIRKMKAEEKIITKLIKKTQEARYKKKSMSELIYKIRLRKYNDRLNEIREQLPVLEGKVY